MMHVLLAYDGSAHSKFALQALRELPGRAGIDLSLLTISKMPKVAGWVGESYSDQAKRFIRESQEADKTMLAETESTIGSEFRSVRTDLLVGSPGRGIVEYAQSHSIDLVVAGAIGHSALSRVLLGSVSDYVATSAACSVLVVRPSQSQPAGLSPAPEFPKRILLGISNTESDERLADWLDRLQLPPGTEVDLLCVMESQPGYDLDVLRRESTYWKEVRHSAVRQIESAKTKLEAAGYCVDTSLVDAPHIGAALVDHIAKRECNLVIVGDFSRNLVSRVLLGSTSRHVLRQAPCSVLIAR